MSEDNVVEMRPRAEESSKFADLSNRSVTIAEAISVKTATDYTAAAEVVKGFSALDKKIAEFFEPMRRKAREALDTIIRTEKDQREPIAKAKQIIKDKMLAFDAAQERIRAEEERQRQEAARKLEEDRRLQEAIDAEADGDAAAADEILAEPVEAPVIHVAKLTPKVEGIASRETWDAEVTDFLALLRFIVDHPEYVNLILVNVPALRSLARSLKSALNLPGVRVFSKKNIAARG